MAFRRPVVPSSRPPARAAIEFHLEGLRAEGQAVPVPHSYATFVEVAA